GGTSKATATESAVSGLTSRILRLWKRGVLICGGGPWPRDQWVLNQSKGSRQARQRWSDLQGVEPYADRASVRAEPQRGQRMASGGDAKRSTDTPVAAALPGGAMP